jgi:hypothetical protein
MAKKPVKPAMPKLLQPVEPTPERIGGDKSQTVSVGLRQSEAERLAEIAAEIGVTRNNLLSYVLRQFMRDYEAGKVDVEKNLKTVKGDIVIAELPFSNLSGSKRRPVRPFIVRHISNATGTTIRHDLKVTFR